MQDEISGGGSTTYVVTVHREQAGDVTVVVDGPPDALGRTEARNEALRRVGGGEAVAWGAVGDPWTTNVAPVGTSGETAGAVA